MSPRRCFLCDQQKTPKITLHKFPKNAELCSLWKKICNLQDYDTVSSLYLCSDHFTKDDYRVLRIKPSSYPSVNVPIAIMNREASANTSEEEFECIQLIEETMTPEPCPAKNTRYSKRKIQMDIKKERADDTTLNFSTWKNEEDFIDIKEEPLEPLNDSSIYKKGSNNIKLEVSKDDTVKIRANDVLETVEKDLNFHDQFSQTNKTFEEPIDKGNESIRSNNSKRILKENSGEKKFECNICQKSFGTKKHLKRHLHVHSGNKKYKCNICQKLFKIKEYLKSHLDVHIGNKKYECNICQKSFRTKGYLKYHLDVHSGDKKYECNICQKSFLTKGYLKQHLLVHSGVKKYECNICQKSFIRKNNLKVHLVVHSGDKKYDCNICQKSFGRKDCLKSHLLCHADEKKFKCYICEKTFKRVESLRYHSSIHAKEA